MTEAEKILWSCLRNRKFYGFKFRRQHPVSDFIADFYCHEANLVVEVDGEYHNDSEQRAYDENRTYHLKELRIKVIRFTNSEVINNLDYVLHEISTHLLDTCTNWDTP